VGFWVRAASKKIGTPCLFLKLLKLETSNLVGYSSYTTWVWEYLTKKQRLGPKFAGAGLEENSKYFGTSYLFLQPLERATLNLVHNLCLGSMLQ